MSLLQVFSQWTDVAPVLTKDQHVNYQRGLCDLMCDLFCSVMCCDPFSYTRVVLIHWTLHRPLLCFAGVGTRNYYRKMGYELEGPYMVKDLYEPKNDWTWTVSHLDTVTSGHCHIWTVSHLDSSCIGTNYFIYQDTVLRTVPAVHSVERGLCFRRWRRWSLGFLSQFLLFI